MRRGCRALPGEKDLREIFAKSKGGEVDKKPDVETSSDAALPAFFPLPQNFTPDLDGTWHACFVGYALCIDVR